jgi:hypothetical protein
MTGDNAERHTAEASPSIGRKKNLDRGNAVARLDGHIPGIRQVAGRKAKNQFGWQAITSDLRK